MPLADVYEAQPRRWRAASASCSASASRSGSSSRGTVPSGVAPASDARPFARHGTSLATPPHPRSIPRSFRANHARASLSHYSNLGSAAAPDLGGATPDHGATAPDLGAAASDSHADPLPRSYQGRMAEMAARDAQAGVSGTHVKVLRFPPKWACTAAKDARGPSSPSFSAGRAEAAVSPAVARRASSGNISAPASEPPPRPPDTTPLWFHATVTAVHPEAHTCDLARSRLSSPDLPRSPLISGAPRDANVRSGVPERCPRGSVRRRMRSCDAQRMTRLASRCHLPLLPPLAASRCRLPLPSPSPSPSPLMRLRAHAVDHAVELTCCSPSSASPLISHDLHSSSDAAPRALHLP